MSDSSQNFFYKGFLDAFQQVLSQCSGAAWTGETFDTPAPSDLVWADGTASGTLSGAFAFGFQPAAGIVLAQILTMAEQPSAAFGSEEKEAVAEFLRQVCGIAATALNRGSGGPALNLVGEAALPAPSTVQSLRLSAGDRTLEIFLAIDAALQSSLPIETASALTAPGPAETDHVGLHTALANKNLDLLMNVRLGVRLRFGSRRMKLREVLEFHSGSIVELDRQVQEPVDLLVDNKLIARGEVVVIDGNYGLKVLDVVSPKQCMDALY